MPGETYAVLPEKQTFFSKKTRYCLDKPNDFQEIKRFENWRVFSLNLFAATNVFKQSGQCAHRPIRITRRHQFNQNSVCKHQQMYRLNHMYNPVSNVAIKLPCTCSPAMTSTGQQCSVVLSTEAWLYPGGPGSIWRRHI